MMEDVIYNYIIKQLSEVPMILNRKLSYKNIKFNSKNEFDKLRLMIDSFLDGESEERYFVLPGIRGVGKTTILYQCYEYLLKEKNFNSSDLLYISCETTNFAGQTDIKKIIGIYLDKIHNTTPALLDKPVFIFIDEAHFDENWAMNGKTLYDESPYIFLILTGSSSLHLNYNSDAARRLNILPVMPLNYSQHLSLKYNYQTDIRNDLIDLIFTGNIESAQQKELKIQKDLIGLEDYPLNDWNIYLNYGGFPATFNIKFEDIIVSKIWTIISKVITVDMANVFNLNRNNQNLTYKTLVYLASQKPGEISHDKLSNYLNCSKATINNIINTLEKTQLIFHNEAYGGASKKVKKPWKYNFATPSIRNCINIKFGNSAGSKSEYEGILLENQIASNLFNLNNNNVSFDFNVYYDSQKGGVDFIVKKLFGSAIPIESGIGSKTKRQVKKAMNKYDADHGVVVSNKTDFIEKEDDVIFIPPKTFSFL